MPILRTEKDIQSIVGLIIDLLSTNEAIDILMVRSWEADYYIIGFDGPFNGFKTKHEGCSIEYKNDSGEWAPLNIEHEDHPHDDPT